MKIKNQHRSGGRQTWGDGKHQRVENCINAFIVGLISTAERKRLEKIEADRRERERILEQQRREEERRRLELEQAFAFDLDTRVTDWLQAKSIREFVSAVEESARARGEDTSEDSDLGRWIQWARDRVDRVEKDAVETVLELRRRPNPGPFGR